MSGGAKESSSACKGGSKVARLPDVATTTSKAARYGSMFDQSGCAPRIVLVNRNRNHGLIGQLRCDEIKLAMNALEKIC